MRELVLGLLAGAACLIAGCGFLAAEYGGPGAYMVSPDSRAGSVLGRDPFDGTKAGGEAGGEASKAPMPEAASQTPPLAPLEPRKVIYTGRFNVVVTDPDASVKAVKALAEKLGGYTLRMTLSAIAIRVPAEKFDSAAEELARLGTVIEKDVAAQDVTDQVLDLQVRLKNAKATQQKLLALLEKSQAVRDTLEIEKELQRITTEIERLEGQLNKLSHEVAFSMLTVLFNQTKNAPAETQVKLPFYWLGRIGLNELLSF